MSSKCYERWQKIYGLEIVSDDVDKLPANRYFIFQLSLPVSKQNSDSNIIHANLDPFLRMNVLDTLSMRELPIKFSGSRFGRYRSAYSEPELGKEHIQRSLLLELNVGHFNHDRSLKKLICDFFHATHDEFAGH